MSSRPLLAVSMGDPAGIGAEIILKAATVNDVRAEADMVVFGDPLILERAAQTLDVKIRIAEVDSIAAARDHQGLETIALIPVSRLVDPSLTWGAPTEASDLSQVEYVKRAFQAVRDREADALVTAPIRKVALGRAGKSWGGHTEMLAELSDSQQRPVMMLAGPTLKVVPLTTHVSLREVPALLTVERLAHAIRVTNDALARHFGRHRPRIAVAGLNPHAGEQGMFGTEEREVILPAVEQARADGVRVQGPFPPDTVCHRAVSGEFDVVIGMYHDQVLIPLKLLDFDRAVNVTLGLPIIRTSVDHGTAYDIAGKGIASARSMIAALRLGAQMAQEANRPQPTAASASTSAETKPA